MSCCFFKTLSMRFRCQFPVTMDFWLTTRHNPGILCGFQLLYPFKNAAARCSAGSAEHQFCNTLTVNLWLYAGKCQQCFNLGRKQEAAAVQHEKQRFYTHSVTGKKQLFFFTIPYRKGKDTIELGKTLFFPLDKAVQDDLGICRCLKAVPQRFQFSFQIGCIVQFSVIDNCITVFPGSRK